MLRILQGFCVGGEWGGATLMAVEHAPVGKRGLYGAFPQMGAPAGTALATVAFLTVAQLPDEQFLSWGWRIPFLLSAALVVVGLFIRLTIGESPEFVAVHEHTDEVKLPIKVAFQKYWRQILLVAGIYFSQGIFAYICISYFVSYATAVVKLDRTYALLGVFAAGVVAVFLYGFFGSLSDRIGRKTTYMIGAVAMAVSIWPAVALINTGNPWLFALAIVLVFGVAMAPAGGATGSLFSLMFGAEVRYTGVSVGYTLSQITGSAFAPLIAVALYGAIGTTNGLVIYLLAASAVSIVSLLLLPGPWGRKEAAEQLEYAHRQDGRRRHPDVPDRTDVLPTAPSPETDSHKKARRNHEHIERIRHRRRCRGIRSHGRHHRAGAGHLRGAGACGVQVELGGEHPPGAHHQPAGSGGPP